MDTGTIIIIFLCVLLLLSIIGHIVVIKPVPVPVPVPVPIGGCAGTRYGCCPNSNVPKINFWGTNCYAPNPPPPPPPNPTPMAGGCAGTRYGCCPNGVTPKMNYVGTNCI
jgi:hypothetical protein